MNDFLVVLSIIGGVFGLIAVGNWTARRVFSWIVNRLPWRRHPPLAMESSVPPTPGRAIDPYRAAYQLALREWGTTINDTGDECGMGWTGVLFQIDPAVAGVSEVLTVLGEARFTPGLRCMVIVDRATITALDRQYQRGVCLAVDWPRQGLEMTLEGAITTIRFFETINETIDPRTEALREKSFSVDLHTEHASDLVPPGWPGKAALFPQPAAAPAVAETQ